MTRLLRSLTALAAATGVLAVGLGTNRDSDVPLIVGSLVGGLCWLAVAWLLAAARATLVVAWLAAVAGLLLVGCTLVATVWGATGTAGRLAALAFLGVLPTLWMSYPTPLPGPLRLTCLPVVVGFGVAVLVWPDLKTVTDTGSLVVAVTLIAAIWWRLERGDPAQREPVLWNAYALGVASLGAIPVSVSESAWPILVLLLLVSCAGPVIGARPPAGVDVRLLILRTAVYAVAVLVVLALFNGLAALVAIQVGGPPSTSALGGLSVVIAVAFFPIRRLLASVLDRLLFGDRLDTVSAATKFGDELAAADDPVAALHALREVLWLPYAALADPSGALAETGTPTTAGDYRIPLRIGGSDVGSLVIGLRHGERRLSTRDRDALRIVVPALAQAVHARALAAALRQSRQDVIRAVEDERRRLRHDLHDSLGPTLTGVAYAADAARNHLSDAPEESDRLLVNVRSDVRDAIADVRRLVDGLRPSALDQLGLVEAVRQHSTHLHAAAGERLDVRLDADPLPVMSAATEVAAYRIITEALTNVARHAASDRADVAITAQDHALVIVVADKGGENPRLNWIAGVGLSSMRERAEQLGGTFHAAPGDRGGVVRASLPLG